MQPESHEPGKTFIAVLVSALALIISAGLMKFAGVPRVAIQVVLGIVAIAAMAITYRLIRPADEPAAVTPRDASPGAGPRLESAGDPSRDSAAKPRL